MKTLQIVELTFLLVGAILIATQIVIPALRGRPLLPLLRSKERHVDEAIATAKESNDIAAKEKHLASLS